jgi:hypothetical protein
MLLIQGYIIMMLILIMCLNFIILEKYRSQMHRLYVIEDQMLHRHWQRAIYDIVVVRETALITPTKAYRLQDNLRSIYDIVVNETTPVTPMTPSPTGTVLQQVAQMKARDYQTISGTPTARPTRDPPPETVSRFTHARKVYMHIPHVRAQVLLDLQSARLQGLPQQRG